MSSSVSRLLIVSNRLPITVSARTGSVHLEPSSGGLATGLRGAHDRAGGQWIGWPGDLTALTDTQRAELDEELTRQRILPVELTAEEVRRYYEAFSNGVIWPLFHYLMDRVPLDANEWAAYVDANRKFADAIVAAYQPGDLVWVHDYQLMLVPGMVRERVPLARIGFFLHIPFPSFEVFRILPWRQTLLEGLLGADLIGFHTPAYARYCMTALRHILDLEPEGPTVSFAGRTVRLAAFPMGIDTAHFEALAATEPVLQGASTIREQAGARRLLLGVDRMDYTKGIPRRLLAFERFLQRYPDWAEKVRFIQVAVPSRGEVDSYKSFRREVNELVGRINGAAGTVTDVPVHYLNRGVPVNELIALYRAADVMLVTPLRDGMNLVSKEFVAARVDEDGVLLLSEFAGAADELGEALLVNPFDLDAVADAILRALTMHPAERRARMRALRRRVRQHTVHVWARQFIDELDRVSSDAIAHALPVSTASEVSLLVSRLRDAERLVLLLDYDGTLTPLMDTPELAKPDAALLDLLGDLTKRPNTALHIVSGRGRETLEAWLGDLPIGLWAEHGLWRRDARTGGEWRPALTPSRDWMAQVRPVMEQLTADTPGSLVEDKGDSLAWHYRMSDPVLGVDQARLLRARVEALFPPGAAGQAGQEVDVIPGSKVLEVRPRGVQKGLAVQALTAEEPSSTRFVAIGDDRTDEDLFQALPADGLAVHVGPEASRAAYRLPNVRAVRLLLRALLDGEVTTAAPGRGTADRQDSGRQ